MQNTKVEDVMTRDPAFVRPGDTLQDAAARMKQFDCGILPVGTKDKLEGIITDRDIVIRSLAEGHDPATEKVESCMTEKACFCSEGDTLTEAAEEMRRNGVSRLVVKGGDGKVAGVLSFGSILRKDRDREEVAQVVASATGKAA